MTALAPPPVAPESPSAEPESIKTREVELIFDGWEEQRVHVVGVRDQVAEVVLEAEDDQVLPVGGVAEARHWIRGLGRPLTALVRVVWRMDAQHGPRYGLALPLLGQRGGALTASLCAAFNRRSNQRVRPEPLSPPWVTLHAGEGQGARGRLGDISLGGLSVQVAAEAELLLSRVHEVRLSVQLPTRKEPVQAMASIRSRRLCGSQVRYGLEFTPGAAPRAAVLDYVRERRDDCLRRARRTTAPEQI